MQKLLKFSVAALLLASSSYAIKVSDHKIVKMAMPQGQDKIIEQKVLAMKSLTPDQQELIKRLEDVKDQEIKVFGVAGPKDKEGKQLNLDCAKIFQEKNINQDAPYFAVHHSHSFDEHNDMYLSSSKDLKNWDLVTKLDTRASQGKFHVNEDGSFLLAYEQSNPQGCFIKLRYYPDIEALRANKFTHEHMIDRTLAPTSEGTPSFEKVEMNGKDPTKSLIQLRFHYYHTNGQDQQGKGTLENFSQWKSESMSNQNYVFDEVLEFRGNVGSRAKFSWKGQEYYVQEAEKAHDTWDTWRVFLCDSQGYPLKQLEMKTPLGGKSFANPNLTQVKDPKTGKQMYVMTTMMTTEGNPGPEAGNLLYAVSAEP